jgi:hypothetical protein
VAPEEIKETISLNGKSALSSKIIFKINAALLIYCSLFLLVVLAIISTSHLSPMDQAEIFGHMTGTILIFLTATGISVLLYVKNKKYRLLQFLSVGAAIITVAGFYYILDAQRKMQELATKADRQFSENASIVMNWYKQGTAGDLPELKPTGNLGYDSCLKVVKNFFLDLSQTYHKFEKDKLALQIVDVFDKSLITTNKLIWETEIQKRINAQIKIQVFSSNMVLMSDKFKNEFAALDLKQSVKDAAFSGLETTLLQYNKFFALETKQLSLEQDYLRFFSQNINASTGYQIKADAATTLEFNSLIKRIHDGQDEIQNTRNQM